MSSKIVDGINSFKLFSLNLLSHSTGATLLKQATEALDEDQSYDNPFKIFESDDKDSEGDGNIDIMCNDFYL